MLCKCGCGKEFNPSRTTLWRMMRNENCGHIYGHQYKKGKDSATWKGGRFISANGYIYLHMPEHPNALKKGCIGYIAEHRFVMSQHIGRPLNARELVHHRNGNKSDNKIDNLVIITREKHATIHTTGADNGNWSGGRRQIICKFCHSTFLPKDRKNDYGAMYCSKKCFYSRNKHD